jgi:hypothetical protein
MAALWYGWFLVILDQRKPRKHTIWFIYEREHTKMTLTEIGRVFTPLKAHGNIL